MAFWAPVDAFWSPCGPRGINILASKFILWGNFAKSKAKLIDIRKHKIVSSVHPSPLSSRYNCRGQSNSFFGHNNFNKVKDYLFKNNKNKIDWNI